MRSPPGEFPCPGTNNHRWYTYFWVLFTIDCPSCCAILQGVYSLLRRHTCSWIACTTNIIWQCAPTRELIPYTFHVCRRKSLTEFISSTSEFVFLSIVEEENFRNDVLLVAWWDDCHCFNRCSEQSRFKSCSPLYFPGFDVLLHIYDWLKQYCMYWQLKYNYFSYLLHKPNL